MADGVGVTAGSGTTIATDEVTTVNGGPVSARHAQRNKIDSKGVDGEFTDTSESSPFPVRPVVDVFDVTLTPDTSAVADGDVLADTQLVGAVFLESGGARTLMTVHVLDEADQGQGFDLVFLDANNSLGTENSTPNITAANARAIVGRVPISSAEFFDLGVCRIATVTGIGLTMQGNGGTSLYVAAISRGIGTYTSSSIRLKLGFT